MHEISDGAEPLNKIEDEKKLVKIKELASSLGLGFYEARYDEFASKSLEELEKMKSSEFICYICEKDMLSAFYVQNNKMARENINLVPEKYVEQYATCLLTLGGDRTFRGNPEEDKFLNKLAAIGLYVFEIKSDAPIIDLNSFIDAFYKKKINGHIGKSFGTEVELGTSKGKREFIANMKERMLADESRKMVDLMLHDMYVNFGKESVVEKFSLYNRKEGIPSFTCEDKEYRFPNEKTALKVLNAKYIESVLNHANEIEYNFELNPKARRLGEAIIAMYSVLKAKGMKDDRIADSINEALTELVQNGKYDKFVLLDSESAKAIVNFANGQEMTDRELKHKSGELLHVSARDAIRIMVSTELNEMIENENKEAIKNKVEPTLKKDDLEVQVDQVRDRNDSMQILVANQVLSATARDESTSKANIQAEKTQLLEYVLADSRLKANFKSVSKKPIWVKHNEAEKYLNQLVQKYSCLKREIENLEAEIASIKMEKSGTTSEDIADGSHSIEAKREELENKLREYEEIMEFEEHGKVISTYISLCESAEKMKFDLSNSREHKGRGVERS